MDSSSGQKSPCNTETSAMGPVPCSAMSCSDELARRFDRSMSWVSRRLALVELLPEAIQQHVREGKISAHVAMKYLAPVARINLEDCQRMAAAFAQYHCDTRQAGQLYAAWRGGSPVVRQRLLDEPALFFKAQRQAEPKATAAPAAELLRDLEMAAAIVNRATRRLAGAAGHPLGLEMDGLQREAARRQIERLENRLRRLAGRMGRRGVSAVARATASTASPFRGIVPRLSASTY